MSTTAIIRRFIFYIFLLLLGTKGAVLVGLPNYCILHAG